MIHVMQKYFFIIFIVVLYACKEAPSINLDPVTAAVMPVTTSDEPLKPDVPVETERTWTDQFFQLVNNHRASLGLRAVIASEELSEIALIHSQNMASGKVAFGHTGFSGRCSDARAALGGGNWCAENVANGQSTPQAVFTSWMNSSGHRANIESSRATHSGLGYKRSATGKYYWTQLVLEL